MGLRDHALLVPYLDTRSRCNELLTPTPDDAHLDVARPPPVVDGRGGRLTVWGVERRIRDLAATALPGRRVYCDLFRHTFATNYLVYGLGDELHLMATLGHTTLGMTRQ